MLLLLLLLLSSLSLLLLCQVGSRIGGGKRNTNPCLNPSLLVNNTGYIHSHNSGNMDNAYFTQRRCFCPFVTSSTDIDITITNGWLQWAFVPWSLNCQWWHYNIMDSMWGWVSVPWSLNCVIIIEGIQWWAFVPMWGLFKELFLFLSDYG